jgi:DNA-binding Lrp family transcriptional regulator
MPGEAMQTIFIQVKCDLGKAYQVADQAVQEVEEVSEVYSTSGQYDLMMKCYLPDAADIGHFVTDRVQTLPGVKDTFTLITFKAFG